jgi:hypothetical protein
MKKLVFVCVIAFSAWSVNAQYRWGVGLALGSPSGISAKVFTDNSKALDFTLGFWHDYTNITAMYEIHRSFNDLGDLNEFKSQLKWYYGPGAHIGSWYDSHYNSEDIPNSNMFIGIDGVIGIEWKPDIPFAFSVDVRPGINIVGGASFFWQSEIGIRYTFD